MPVKYKGLYDKSIRSKAFAIKSFCLECTGYTRSIITTCTDEGCPLWHHRPYQSKGRNEGDDDESGDPGS
jgi:hypothetical protein